MPTNAVTEYCSRISDAPLPSTRERPPGCRTIFIGGVPETATEEILQEVFQEFGSIVSLRKSKKKNFAHVRYEEESNVERALFLSGGFGFYLIQISK